MSVMRTKSIEQSISETDEPEYQLKKRLSALDLTVFGIGVIIGAGIFTVTGRAAAALRRAVDRHLVRRRPPSAAGWPRSATPSSPRRCRSPGRPTRSPTPPSASWSPGSSAGTCCSSSCSARAWWPRAGRSTPTSCSSQLGITWPDVPGLRLALRPARPSCSSSLHHRSWCRVGIKESMRVNLVLVGDQALHRAVRHHRGHRLHQRRRTTRRSSRRRRPPKSAQGIRRAAHPGALRLHARHLRRRWASSPAPRSSSSPTSASTSSPPPPRRPRTPSATCRSASSPRWSSARSSTRRRCRHHRAWSSTTRSTRGRPGHRVRVVGKSGYATLIAAAPWPA